MEINTNKFASTYKRFSNCIIDFLIIKWLVAPIVMQILILLMKINTEIVVAIFPVNIPTLLGAALIFWYYSVFEFYLGKTPAKFITMTKVVTSEFEKPSWLQIVKRNSIRLIPFEALAIFSSSELVGHDSLSDTRVINE